MKYSVEVKTKEFSNEVSKIAYLNACKWLANNIYSKGISEFIQTQIIKKKSKIPTFKVVIYVCLDLDEQNEKMCEECKHMKNIFYCTDNLNCSKCEFKAFTIKQERNIKNMVDFIRERLKNE